MIWGLWQGYQMKRQKKLQQEIMDSVHEGILRFGADRRIGTCLVRFELRNLGPDPTLAGIVATGQDITELQLAPKEAYELQPEVTAAAGAGYAIERPAEKAPEPFKRSYPWI